MFCTECGNNIDGAKFCFNCGTPAPARTTVASPSDITWAGKSSPLAMSQLGQQPLPLPLPLPLPFPLSTQTGGMPWLPMFFIGGGS